MMIGAKIFPEKVGGEIMRNGISLMNSLRRNPKKLAPRTMTPFTTRNVPFLVPPICKFYRGILRADLLVADFTTPQL